MILPIHELVRARIAESVARLYGIEPTDPMLADIPVELAPNRTLGDFSVPLAFSRSSRRCGVAVYCVQRLAAGLCGHHQWNC